MEGEEITQSTETVMTWVDYFSAFESFAIGAAALLGVFLGYKTLRHFLLEEDLKERHRTVRKRNAELSARAFKALRYLERISKDGNMPLNPDHLIKVKNLTRNLEQKSYGASSSAQTYCYLLRNIIENLKVNYSNSRAMEILTADHLYAFTFNVISQMLYDIDHTAVAPSKLVVTKGNKFEPGTFGVHLASDNEAIKKTYAKLDEAHAETPYFINFLKVLRSTSPAVERSLQLKPYIPPSFTLQEERKNKDTTIANGSKIFLVRTAEMLNLGDGSVTIHAYYHNLDSSVVDMESVLFSSDVWDCLVDEISQKTFNEFFSTRQFCADGSVKVTIKGDHHSIQDIKYKMAARRMIKPQKR